MFRDSGRYTFKGAVSYLTMSQCHLAKINEKRYMKYIYASSVLIVNSLILDSNLLSAVFQRQCSSESI